MNIKILKKDDKDWPNLNAKIICLNVGVDVIEVEEENKKFLTQLPGKVRHVMTLDIDGYKTTCEIDDRTYKFLLNKIQNGKT